MTDEDIISLCLNGNRNVYSELVKRYQIMVYNIAYRMLGEKNIAEDIAQESFIAAYTSLRKFNKSSKFSTWLCGITLNKCRDFIRKKKNEVSLEEIDVHFKYQGANQEEAMQKKQTEKQLRYALAGLPEKYREAVVLKHLQGLDYKEMATASGLSVSAIKVRTHRAREMMKQLLKKGGLLDE